MKTRSEKLIVDEKKRTLVSPEVIGLAADWLEPEFWACKARPVVTGGRGGAWFVDSPVGDLVLRQYRRGGVVSRISNRNYLFSGYNRTRSFAEFRLLKELRRLNLPVPEPVAALASRNSPLTYQASILVRRIPDAVPLPETEALQENAFWRQVGAMVRQFHDAGLYHSDLNCDNILVAGGMLYLIDFDKCELRKATRNSAAWKRQNLSRLKRSVHKRCGRLSSASIDQLWQVLCEAYEH